MKASRLGILSAVIASACCVGPLVLVLLGLGSLGLGAAIGRYHWWFILAAIALLAVAWRSYLKEASRCRAARCEMARGKRTRTALLLASVVVAVFVSLNLYTYASQPRKAPALTTSSRSPHMASVVIPVDGMTCFTCELAVESSLKRLPGIHHVDARVGEAAVHVRYDSTKVRLDDVMAAINKTGYRASQPQ